MRIAIVSVGDELLVGDTVNTNAAWLGERLDARGATVERVTTVPDRLADIAQVVNESLAAYDAVVVTGGLGPTHDDVTMEGVAAAVGRSLEPHAEASAWLADRGGYSADDGDPRTVELPAGARFLPNDEGVAPGAVVESVYVLPGVPAEMKAMFGRVENEFTGTETYVERVLVDEPESALADRLADLQRRFDVTVGSHPGDGVRVKISAADAGAAKDAAGWLREHANVIDVDAADD
ncbi:molybdopterin-binding protein [Haloprofundus sp. MHR1]|uniref:competence/damage-inducible protein A n=1 Tax=Haloprofundus sp. MHR1 TaxID=2572921 RepID=UPI0010BECA31|nr:molybdopterin-binding protein [Haloprofundus sp. MHR1]QCJ48140.1 competence/damage-inducible protein A [Haloprofundus sp. MHR1]